MNPLIELLASHLVEMLKHFKNHKDDVTRGEVIHYLQGKLDSGELKLNEALAKIQADEVAKDKEKADKAAKQIKK